MIDDETKTYVMLKYHDVIFDTWPWKLFYKLPHSVRMCYYDKRGGNIPNDIIKHREYLIEALAEKLYNHEQ